MHRRFGALAVVLLSLPGLAFPQAFAGIWERRNRLEREDLRSVKQWFHKKNPTLTRFYVADKRPVDSTYSVMAVTAADESRRSPRAPWFGVFAVYGKTNQVYMVLDLATGPDCCTPELEEPSAETVYLDWIGDYGFYGGTYKYSYNLTGRRPARRYAYRRFSVERAETRDGELCFLGGYESPAEPGVRSGSGRVVLVHEDSGSRWRVRQPVAADEAARTNTRSADAPDAVRAALPPLPGGGGPPPGRILRAGMTLWLYVPEGELPGWGRQKSGVYVISGPGKSEFYPVPVPTMELYRRLRSRTGAVAVTPDPDAGGIENSIGPFAFDGEKLWFANRFYDGEGTSGVGAVGSFDVGAREYEMRYLPEVAPWSGSVLLLDRESVWIGLMRQPEGSAYGGGVIQFDKRTGTARKYPIYDYVSTMTRLGGWLYFGTTHGVYALDTDRQALSRIRIEPGASGTRDIVERPVPMQ